MPTLRSDAAGCPVRRAIALLDGRWTLLVVRELFAGPRRFGELQAAIGGISARLLSDRLRRLAAAGVVAVERDAAGPGAARYRLEARGEALRPVIDALAAWGGGLPGA